MLQHTPKSLLCLGGAEQFTGWAAHAKSHVPWSCLSCPWSWSCSTGTREAVRRLLPLSHFCHDHSALPPATGKWRGQRERPQGLDQTSHPVPVAADSAAATSAFKLSPYFESQALSSCCSHFLLSLALPGCFQLLQFAAAARVTPLEWKAAEALCSRSSPWLPYWFSSQDSHLWPPGCLCQA